MSSAREQILKRLRAHLDKESTPEQRRQQVNTRLAQHPRGPLRNLPDDLTALFMEKIHAVSATLTEVTGDSAIAQAVEEYLNAHQLAHRLVCAPLERLKLNWGNLEVRYDRAVDSDRVAISHASYAIAETGSLVLPSSASRPTTLNFLPDYFICVLEEKNILADMEALWQKHREENTAMPRVINLVTGPSRTADVEQTIQLGAHGPRQLHVILVK